MELPPCTFGVPLIEYFNDPTIKELLHISPDALDWDMCTNHIRYTSDYAKGSEFIYRAFADKDYRMLFYSGDTDGAVPTYGSI